MTEGLDTSSRFGAWFATIRCVDELTARDSAHTALWSEVRGPLPYPASSEPSDWPCRWLALPGSCCWRCFWLAPSGSCCWLAARPPPGCWPHPRLRWPQLRIECPPFIPQTIFDYCLAYRNDMRAGSTRQLAARIGARQQLQSVEVDTAPPRLDVRFTVHPT